MAHEMIRSLPSEILERLDMKLTKGETAKAVADWLKDSGLFPQVALPSLQKAVRRYRHDVILIPEQARRTAYEQHADPRTRAKVREQITALGVHAGWKRMIDAAEKTHWVLTEQYSKLGAAAALSDKLRQSSLTLSKLYSDYSKFLLESGLIPKPANVHHILAANIVIQSEQDAGQIIEALIEYEGRTRDVRRDHGHLESAVKTMSHMLEHQPTAQPVTPKPLTLEQRRENVTRSFEASIERLAKDPALAETVSRMRETASLMRAEVREEAVEEPETLGAVPIDAPEVEVIPRGRVIDADYERIERSALAEPTADAEEPAEVEPEPVRTRGELRARGEPVEDDGIRELHDVW